MTQDEIIEMWKNSGDLEILGMPYSKIEAFAKLIAEKERNACAKIADEWAVGWPHPSQSIAEWIRKRT
jgi:hypothetical protein